LPFTPCERPYVAISNDAGDTWRLSLVADTETIGWGELALGIDGQGNLYATWADAADRLPYLSISRDGASHWSTPLMIAAPGVVAEPLLLATSERCRCRAVVSDACENLHSHHLAGRHFSHGRGQQLVGLTRKFSASQRPSKNSKVCST